VTVEVRTGTGRGTEKAALLGWLQAQRDSVTAIVTGLDPTLAGSSVVPSGWTTVGLVGHLADAEHLWAEIVLAAPWSPGDDDGYAADSTVSALTRALSRYQQQAERTDAILADLPLDARPPGLDQPGLPVEFRDVREVVLHLIEETARHAGHLDIARELLDGRTGLGPR